jgi:hypothetical protein
MYVDSSPIPTRRSITRVRGARRKPTPRTAFATAAERRTRLSDAIVSQWLLEQVPSDHRHPAERRGEVAV